MLARGSENGGPHRRREADLIEKVIETKNVTDETLIGTRRHSVLPVRDRSLHDAVCPANPACFSQMPQPCRNVKVRSGVRERVGVLVKADAPVPYLANLVLCNLEGGQCRLRGLEEADGLRGLREREVN